MYRAPSTGSAGSGLLKLLAVFLGLMYLTACGDVGVAPELEFPADIDPVELEMATDAELTSALVEDVANTLAAAGEALAVAELQSASDGFRAAREAHDVGDDSEATRRGIHARKALARALAAGGERPVRDYLDRTRNLRDRLAAGEDIGEFESAPDVLASLESSVAAFETDFGRGDRTAAAERAIRANQEVDRDRARRHDRDPEPFARFSVAMGWEAVDHAGRLLENEDVTERQEQLLSAAVRMAESAATALGEGRFHKAIALSQRAVSLSLMAVVHPEPTEADAAEIEALALAELEAAEGRDLTEFEESVLERAWAAFDKGVEAIRSGDLGGVKLVWRAGMAAAVIGI